MKKRSKFLSLLLAGAIAGTVAFAGCSLVSSDPQADMNQVIAEVDISKSANFDDDLSAYTGAITSKSIYKRDLVAFFLNSASSILSSGSTYGEAFQTLSESLVDNEILIQYATMATLKQMVDDNLYADAEAAVSAFLAYETEAERFEFLLDYQTTTDDKEGDENVDYVMLVQYSLYSSINTTIDGYEETVLESNTEDETSTATLPAGVDTEVENFYPVKDGELDYNVYTGYDGYLKPQSGIYEDDALEGSTRFTRMTAYNNFIQLLDANFLITEDDDIRDVISLSYVQNQYVNLLCQQLVNNYFDRYETELEGEMSANGYAKVAERYNELKMQQTASYSASNSAFETAMGDLSSESFILYAPSTNNGNKFGYVYNILLPFSQSQSDALSAFGTLRDNGSLTENEYYALRNNLLAGVTTTDQRSSWFNGGIDYSFDASATSVPYYTGADASTQSARNILFFEDNLTNNTRYEELEKYYGSYTYNGVAVKNDDDSYTLIPYEVSVDDMMNEISGYLGFVGEQEDKDFSFDWTVNSDFYSMTEFTVTDESDPLYGEVDYENFIYAYGKVNIADFSSYALMDKETEAYKVMSAVNELQYAYTTDTAVLSEYVGYSVSAYSTSYIKEFEYACQKAISDENFGVGTFMVLAGDYGWHIIYVTNVLDDVNGYVPDWENNVEKEGTFENLFYEMLRSSALETAVSEQQLDLLESLYSEDVTVTVYEDRFSDLTSLTTTVS